jgi:hypothetical protein
MNNFIVALVPLILAGAASAGEYVGTKIEIDFGTARMNAQAGPIGNGETFGAKIGPKWNIGDSHQYQLGFDAGFTHLSGVDGTATGEEMIRTRSCLEYYCETEYSYREFDIATDLTSDTLDLIGTFTFLTPKARWGVELGLGGYYSMTNIDFGTYGDEDYDGGGGLLAAKALYRHGSGVSLATGPVFRAGTIGGENVATTSWELGIGFTF